MATYVRTQFGPGDQVTEAQVALTRAGGEKPLLAKIARLWLPDVDRCRAGIGRGRAAGAARLEEAQGQEGCSMESCSP